MKKIFTLMVCALALTCTTAKADLLLTDDFDYNVGDLYNQGSWVKLSTNTEEPIQVVNTPLTFEGYQTAATGKAVVLNGKDNSKAQRLQKGFAADGITSGVLYYSMLVKPTEFPQSNSSKYIISGFSGKTYSGWGDGVGSIYAAVSISKGSAEGKFKFGIAPSASVPTVVDTEYDLGDTFLVAVKYDFSTKNIDFWINPTEETVATTVTLEGKGTINATNGVQAICVYQQGSTLAQGNIIIDQVRVANDWASLFTEKESSGDPDPEPEPEPSITLSASSQTFSNALVQGDLDTLTVNVKAANLTENIAISFESACLSASAATIDKEAAMSAAGADVQFYLNSTSAATGSVEVTFASGDVSEALALSWYAASATVVNSIAELRSHFETATESDMFNIAGNVTVSCVDGGTIAYVQDATGGIAINYWNNEIDEDIVENAVLSNLVLYYIAPAFGSYTLAYYNYTVSGTAQIDTVAVTLAEMKADPYLYEGRLVKLENVNFGTKAKFSASSVSMTQNGEEGKVKIAQNADYIGTDIPKRADIVGVSTSGSGNIIMPRRASDINILEKFSETVAVENAGKTTTIWAEAGSLCVHAEVGSEVAVYNLLGVQVACVSTVEPTTRIALPVGAYVIRTGDKSVKLIVK